MSHIKNAQDSQDAFVRTLYKNYRKPAKKLEKIFELEKREKLNEDQRETVSRKAELKQQVKEINQTYTLYLEATKDAKPVEQAPEAPKEEESKAEPVPEVKQEQEETVTLEFHQKELEKAVKSAQKEARKKAQHELVARYQTERQEHQRKTCELMVKLLTLNNNLPLIQANGLKLDDLIAEETFHSLTKLFAEVIPLHSSIGEHIEQASDLLEKFASKSSETLHESVTFKAAHEGLVNLMESEQMQKVSMGVYAAPVQQQQQPVMEAPPGIFEEPAKQSKDWADEEPDQQDEEEEEELIPSKQVVPQEAPVQETQEVPQAAQETEEHKPEEATPEGGEEKKEGEEVGARRERGSARGRGGFVPRGRGERGGRGGERGGRGARGGRGEFRGDFKGEHRGGEHRGNFHQRGRGGHHITEYKNENRDPQQPYNNAYAFKKEAKKDGFEVVEGRKPVNQRGGRGGRGRTEVGKFEGKRKEIGIRDKLQEQ